MPMRSLLPFCLAAAFAFCCQGAMAQEGTLQEVKATYQGTVNNKPGCTKTYEVKGWSLGGDAGRPLFLYFIGTNFGDDKLNQGYAGTTPLAVARAMALRGFVAVSVQYDNGVNVWLSNRHETTRCLFDAQSAGGLVQQLCTNGAIPGVDCGLGIATWGHSLGGAVAIGAADKEPRVRAAWATGVNGTASSTRPVPALSNKRIRIVNGSADTVPLVGWLFGNNNDTARLSRQLGLNPKVDCPSQRHQCLRPDGSGWILVQGGAKGELSTARKADHCWFDRESCTGGDLEDPNFLAGNSRISINANADWVAEVVRHPWP